MTNSTTTKTTMDQALEYAALGMAVFPCHGIDTGTGKCTCGDSECEKDAGKHPATAHGFKDATCDPKIIRGWRTEWEHGANIGIATGNGWFVVDVDLYKLGADEAFALLEFEYGRLPRDRVVISGAGGLHFYCKLPPGVEVSSKNGWRTGIDIKGAGGYVIAPPSRHASWRKYSFLFKSGAGADLSLVPDKWLAGPLLPLVNVEPVEQTEMVQSKDSGEGDTETIQSGDTYETQTEYIQREDTEEGIQSRDRVDQSVTVIPSLLCMESVKPVGWSDDCYHHACSTIEQCVLTEPDTHNDKRTNFARRLKSHPELRELDAELTEWMYKIWFDKSLPNMAEEHQNFNKSFAQWFKVWQWVKHDITKGASFMAFEKSLDCELPAHAQAIADGYRSSTKRRLLRWCYILQRDHANAEERDTFYLTSRVIAEHLPLIDKNMAADWMKDFYRDGLLQKVCYNCWAVNTIIVEPVPMVLGKRKPGRRKCGACGFDFTGKRKGQRYRFVIEPPATAEAAA